MDSCQQIDTAGSWHKQHVMQLCLVQNKRHPVGSESSRCLGHKHSQDLSAVQHQKHQPLAHTNQHWLLGLVMDSLESLGLMESGGRHKERDHQMHDNITSK